MERLSNAVARLRGILDTMRAVIRPLKVLGAETFLLSAEEVVESATNPSA
jgi:hypothetical protein